MKRWVCADLNLGDDSLREARGKTFEKDTLWAWDCTVTNKDQVFLLGNIVAQHHVHWLSQIKELPGEKILLLGNNDKNRPRWYEKWGFVEVVPFNRVITTEYYIGPDEDSPNMARMGKIMLSHIPAAVSVARGRSTEFLGLSRKFERLFDLSGCILNIHGHTQGAADETKRTFDVSPEVVGTQLVTLDQICELKFTSKLFGEVAC